MKTTKLAMIHSIARLVPMYDSLCDEFLRDAALSHRRRGLLQWLLDAHGLTPAIYHRFATTPCARSRPAPTLSC